MNQFELIKEIEKNEKKQEFIMNTLTSYLNETEKFKEKDIEIINNFLKDNKVDINKYDKLALKISKKWEKKYEIPEEIKAISLWLAQNHKNLKEDFYNKLKVFLFDFYPSGVVEEYIYATRKEMDKPNDMKVREPAFKKHNMPIKAFLTYLTSKYDSHYEAMMSGQCVTSYEEFLKILKKHLKSDFIVLTQVMDIITPRAQLKLLNLLIEKEEEKTIDYILTDLVNKATAKQVAGKIIKILESKIELKDEVVKLLKSKKKPAREIAVELLIKWKLPENKKLLTPLVNDKSQNIVNMIADFLATS